MVHSQTCPGCWYQCPRAVPVDQSSFHVRKVGFLAAFPPPIGSIRPYFSPDPIPAQVFRVVAFRMCVSADAKPLCPVGVNSLQRIAELRRLAQQCSTGNAKNSFQFFGRGTSPGYGFMCCLTTSFMCSVTASKANPFVADSPGPTSAALNDFCVPARYLVSNHLKIKRKRSYGSLLVAPYFWASAMTGSWRS